ncbi:MAG: hypothetical protein AAF363_14380 [Bacteroidota bacterium]
MENNETLKVETVYSEELIESLGKDFLEKMLPLQTFEDACKLFGINNFIVDFSCFPEKDRKSMESHAKVVIITNAVNRLANDGDEWIADFDDASQDKYEIWWDKLSSGFRFLDCDCWHTLSTVGSRLCYISPDAGEYVAVQFNDIFNDWLK